MSSISPRDTCACIVLLSCTYTYLSHRSHFGSRPFRAQLDILFVACREMVWFSMSLGLLPRVCAFVVPGQSKTHGYSGIVNDVEDLVTDQPAAFVANDVPAAFCAPGFFCCCRDDAGMLGAALSAFEDAGMLGFQASMWNDDSGASYFMKNDGF